VRCGKQMVIDEVEAAGFTLEDEVDIPALSENYVIRFRRK
jgi:predicted methyltransferase